MRIYLCAYVLDLQDGTVVFCSLLCIFGWMWLRQKSKTFKVILTLILKICLNHTTYIHTISKNILNLKYSQFDDDEDDGDDDNGQWL